MSILIDNIDKTNLTEIKGKWYIAKPIEYFTYNKLISRFKDCIKILKGEAIAVHYKEDE